MSLNVITADLSGCSQSVIATPGLAQWDRGKKLKLTGAELPQAYTVEFCNPGDRQTVGAVGGEDGVDIPNELLQTGKPITAYLVLQTGTDERGTERWISIYVKPRELPPDDIPDPEQASAIDQAIAALDQAVADCGELAEDAEAWAVGTRDGEPVSAADTTYHNNAKYYAEQAAESEEAAEDASQAIQDMSVSAQSGAAGSSAAVQKTVDQQTGAVSLGFTIPRGDTGNGISSIELLSTSGLNKTYRITMTDGDHFDFTVHDGNGISGVAKTATSGLIDTYTISFTDGTSTAFDVKNGKGITSCVLNNDYTLTINYNDGTSTTTVSIRGATGATPDISIGTVTTGAAGSAAAATITGTAEEPVLNLTIPQGVPGEVTAASVAPTFSSSTAYSAGDYVIYSGQLYRFTADHAAGAWTGSDVEQAKLAEDVSNLKSHLSDLGFSVINGQLNVTYERANQEEGD